MIKKRPLSPTLLWIPLFLFFWYVTLNQLDQYPRIHYDEPAIAAPGYTWWQTGIFGSPLFTSFYGQEQIYLEVPPLMSLIQGLSATLWHVGLWQIRYPSVIAGLLILALTGGVANLLTNDWRVGWWAGFILLTWRLIPAGQPFFGSGIPLIDIARLGRYDILVPLCTLSSLACWWQANQTKQYRWYSLSGLFIGLAGLSNIYGLFAGCGLFLVGCYDYYFRHELTLTNLLVWGISVILPWAAWGWVIMNHWDLAQGQWGKHNGRFDLTNWRFYLLSLWHEKQRYALGFRHWPTYARLGFWLFILGLPATILSLRHRPPQNLIPLLAMTLTTMILLALLVNTKRTYYIIAVIPFLAILLAWFGLKKQPLTIIPPPAQSFLLFLWCFQAVWGWAHLAQLATQRDNPTLFWSQLHPHIDEDAVILGPPEYWFGLYSYQYRSIGLLFLLSFPTDPQSLSFSAALEQIGPDIILIHPDLTNGIQMTDTIYGGTRQQAFNHYLQTHHAQKRVTLYDYDGQPVDIYYLNPP
ncbi:MAG TPA: hypothetical protein VLL52_06410 [Anaerolineae bacterium]|nr:hypothetical protein [Anaerolineae bacterium]